MKDKKNKRLKKKLGKRSGWHKYFYDVIKIAKSKGMKLVKNQLPQYAVFKKHKVSRPEYSDIIKFFSTLQAESRINSDKLPPDGIFAIPQVFSLTENYAESYLFLKKLFYCLYKEKYPLIQLDFSECQFFDLDASVCMDILLGEFINYYKECERRRCDPKVENIRPINFDKDVVKKVLFSIGAFKNIKNIEIKFDDIIPFPLVIGDNYSPKRGRDKEIEVTKLVDYIATCLKKLNHTLTWQAEDQLSKVIGEALINAAEHSGRDKRYSIGYFQETSQNSKHVGVFKLVIFSFGRTIYQNFKRDEVKDLEVVSQMKELSQKYTTKKWLISKQFEEETLWTLYALQEGVTSVRDKKRGNGSIQFIENFFNLKGDMTPDDLSSLAILSGNSRITFDGKYQIQEQKKGSNTYKMMTFNKSGKIEDKPDEKYVTFVDNFFPGTMIVAKIYINFNSIEKESI